MKQILSCFFILFHVNLFAQPVISSFAPVSGPIGTSVVLTGTGFSTTPSSNIVFVGDVRATVNAASATNLNITIPAGASYQAITVTVAGLTSHSKEFFNITFPGGGNFSASSFAPRLDLNFGIYGPYVTKSTDLDNDGKSDIVTASYGPNPSGNPFNYLKVLRNTSTAGNLSFAPVPNISSTFIQYYMDIADLDGDGKKDVLLPVYGGSKIEIAKNASTPGNISFGSIQSIPIPMETPYGIAAADFDGDGLVDVAFTNNESLGRVHIHRNLSFGGIISLGPPAIYNTGNSPRDVVYAYINDDNKPDLVVANQYGSSISVFINNSSPGTISFAAKVDFPISSASAYPENIAIGDLNMDGKMDVVVANNNISTVGEVTVFRNTSTGAAASFAASQNFVSGGAGSNPYNIEVADLDGDGKPDIAAKHQNTNAIAILRNSSAVGGTISFQPKVDYTSYDPTRCLHISDLDNDGRPDMISGSAQGYLYSFFRNDMSAPTIGSFAPLSACTGETVTITGTNFDNASQVSFGNVAASSFTVLNSTTISAVVAGGASGAVAVTTPKGTDSRAGFTYTGACAFPPPVITSVQPRTAAAGDTILISGANFSALAASNTVYFGGVSAVVISANSTALQVKVPVGAGDQQVTVTTNNLTAYSPENFALSFSGGTICDPFTSASFGTKLDVPTDPEPYQIIVADFNKDSRLDIASSIYAANKLAFIRNNSALGNFSAVSNSSVNSAAQPTGTCYTDIDGDGKLDVAVVNSGAASVSVSLNSSTISDLVFARQDFTAGSNPRGVYSRDLNGDGKPDLLVSNFGSSNFSVLKNTSSGTGVASFAAQETFSTGNGPVGIVCADIDGDGKPDVAVTNVQSNSVSVFRNTSTVSTIGFAARVDFNVGSQPVALTLYDLDEDGKRDLVVANSASQSISVLKNNSSNGNISFAAASNFSTGSGPFSIQLSDLNGDQRPEVVTSNIYDATVSVLRNTGQGGSINFDTKVDYPTGSTPRSLSLADVDYDGKTDIVASNSGSNSISVLINRQDAQNGITCVNANKVLHADLSGSSYQWQIDDGNGFVNLNNNEIFSGVNTANLGISNVPSNWNGFTFRCIVDGINSSVIQVKILNKWIGAADNNWENPANWSCNKVPDANTFVEIDCSQVVHINSNATCKSIRLGANTYLEVKTGFTFTIMQ